MTLCICNLFSCRRDLNDTRTNKTATEKRHDCVLFSVCALCSVICIHAHADRRGLLWALVNRMHLWGECMFAFWWEQLKCVFGQIWTPHEWQWRMGGFKSCTNPHSGHFFVLPFVSRSHVILYLSCVFSSLVWTRPYSLGGLWHQGISVQSVTGEAVEWTRLQRNSRYGAVLLLYEAELLHHTETCKRQSKASLPSSLSPPARIPVICSSYLPLCYHPSKQMDKLKERKETLLNFFSHFYCLSTNKSSLLNLLCAVQTLSVSPSDFSELFPLLVFYPPFVLNIRWCDSLAVAASQTKVMSCSSIFFTASKSSTKKTCLSLGLLAIFTSSP